MRAGVGTQAEERSPPLGVLGGPWALTRCCRASRRKATHGSGDHHAGHRPPLCRRPRRARTLRPYRRTRRADQRLGRPGPDRLVVSTAAGGTLRGLEGPDSLLGGAGPDRLFGGTGADALYGGAGDDALDGGSGDDELVGEAGSDHLSGGFGHDTVDGGPGGDALDAGAGPDTVLGGDGADVVHGGSGADEIDGGEGDDELHADSGPDRIDAGPGNDRVLVNNGTAVGRVDCGDGEDTIVVNPYDEPGGISNAQALREGRITGCEQVVETAADANPTAGVRTLLR